MTGAPLRTLVISALAAVADGLAPDWAALEAAVRTPSDRSELTVLRSLARICESFRPRKGLDLDS